VNIPLRHSRRALRSKVSSGRGDGRELLGETPSDVVIAPPLLHWAADTISGDVRQLCSSQNG